MHTNREAAPRATVTLRAPAKINLALEVVARLPNGYHGIRSIMLKLDRLVDTVRVRVDERGSGIAIHGDPARIPLDPTNLCHRAADAYLARTGKTARVDVTIEKRIPVAAGLGGGELRIAGAGELVGLQQVFGVHGDGRQHEGKGEDEGATAHAASFRIDGTVGGQNVKAGAGAAPAR